MSKLKKCPFCGGEAKETDDALSARFDYPKKVICSDCGSSHINSKEWNKRPATENKWRDFAELHDMTSEQFSKELTECAQAVLAIELSKSKDDELNIIADQYDGVYQLTFKRVIK